MTSELITLSKQLLAANYVVPAAIIARAALLAFLQDLCRTAGIRVTPGKTRRGHKRLPTIQTYVGNLHRSTHVLNYQSANEVCRLAAIGDKAIALLRCNPHQAESMVRDVEALVNDSETLASNHVVPLAVIHRRSTRKPVMV